MYKFCSVKNACLVLLLVVLASVCTNAVFYLPGVAPRAFAAYDPVKLYVAKLSSAKTQMPYDYYSLPYCRPGTISFQAENLGEVFSGDLIENSVYNLEMRAPKSCAVACKKTLSKEDKAKFALAIDEQYTVHWIVDNLPVGRYVTNTLKDTLFTRGFAVGFKTGTKKGEKHYLYNHVRIIVQFHDDPPEVIPGEEPIQTSKIVGFRVEPMSIHHTWTDKTFDPAKTILETCNSVSPPNNDPKNYETLDLDGVDSDVVFTYDVVWEKSDVEWHNRWDIYLNVNSPNDKVHWFSITNSIMIVLFLTIMIAIILLRALRSDIASYNDQATADETKEESGWKLVHGDVFRPPESSPMLFSVFVGTGMQLILMSVATLTFALFGLLSPSNRGSLVTAFILLFVFMGSFAGYNSSITYKMFRGTEWKQNTILTAFLYPSVIFAVFFGLNMVLYYEGSSGTIALPTFFTLLFLWFCVSVPLVFLGSFFGYKREVVQHPVRINLIPRQIPAQAWYMHPILTTALGGILPFGALSVELYFIMSALWLHQIYYIFGFLFLVMVVLIVTCAEISILLCYFQLCNEDYRWWWRSFLTSGSCAIYMMLYAVWYNLTELDMTGIAPVILYFGYMSMMSFTFFLITGTIGYYSCFWFTHKIYASIKVD